MANLESYVRKYGKKEGRKKYNAWHVEYRKRNKPRMLKYWKSRRALQKANKNRV
jgi:hypothetical protein